MLNSKLKNKLCKLKFERSMSISFFLFGNVLCQNLVLYFWVSLVPLRTKAFSSFAHSTWREMLLTSRNVAPSRVRMGTGLFERVFTINPKKSVKTWEGEKSNRDIQTESFCTIYFFSTSSRSWANSKTPKEKKTGNFGWTVGDKAILFWPADINGTSWEVVDGNEKRRTFEKV